MIKHLKEDQNLIITKMCDWNARVGSKNEENIVSEQGERDERGNVFDRILHKAMFIGYPPILGNTLSKNHV